MPKLIRKTQGGFTLIEVMVVVVIIALLAALAVPGFLRARKRSQATAILNDARALDGAKDQYAIETGRAGSPDPVLPDMLTAYLRPQTRLYADCAAGNPPRDTLGNAYALPAFDTPVKVNGSTISEFSHVIDNPTAFWGGFQ